MKLSILLVASFCTFGLSTPFGSQLPRTFQKRQNSTNSTSSLQVDLGYSIYEGFKDNTTGLSLWRGIRYASPPIGKLRWQLPVAPAINRSQVIQATQFGLQCYQGGPNVGGPSIFDTNIPSSEDCLFLDVYAPPNAKDLPVLVWIHGGGYGAGNGSSDLSPMIMANNGSFVGVSIQYRLGAFGFLASDEVHRFGALNAGIRDQAFALQWVQDHIGLFGGDSGKVTITGESAGAGSVMLQAMAFGGDQGTSLFSNAIAASPYIPQQYDYNSWVPSQLYYSFAFKVGCLTGYAVGSPAVSEIIFECLVGKDIDTLQKANSEVGSSGAYGTWSFLPVTDGDFVRERPTDQLLKKKVNGVRILSGNNADEGPLFVPQNITTEAILTSWLKSTFPQFGDKEVSQVLSAYPSSSAPDPSNPDLFATLGYTGPTAVNQSAVAVGQQQRANNIYAEATFVCPSYWLAEAFPTAYKYQYSVPVATHGSDVTAYFAPPSPNQSPEFSKAFMEIWGNFITKGNPSLSNGDLAKWPKYTVEKPSMANLNETGGTPISIPAVSFAGNIISGTEHVGPGLETDFTIVDAASWEGGRGIRCEFWRSIGKVVPE